MENATTIDTNADWRRAAGGSFREDHAIPTEELDRLTTDIVGALEICLRSRDSLRYL